MACRGVLGDALIVRLVGCGGWVSGKVFLPMRHRRSRGVGVTKPGVDEWKNGQCVEDQGGRCFRKGVRDVGNVLPEVWRLVPDVGNEKSDVRNDESEVWKGLPEVGDDEPEIWNNVPEVGKAGPVTGFDTTVTGSGFPVSGLVESVTGEEVPVTG